MDAAAVVVDAADGRDERRRSATDAAPSRQSQHPSRARLARSARVDRVANSSHDRRVTSASGLRSAAGIHADHSARRIDFEVSQPGRSPSRKPPSPAKSITTPSSSMPVEDFTSRRSLRVAVAEEIQEEATHLDQGFDVAEAGTTQLKRRTVADRSRTSSKRLPPRAQPSLRLARHEGHMPKSPPTSSVLRNRRASPDDDRDDSETVFEVAERRRRRSTQSEGSSRASGRRAHASKPHRQFAPRLPTSIEASGESDASSAEVEFEDEQTVARPSRMKLLARASLAIPEQHRRSVERSARPHPGARSPGRRGDGIPSRSRRLGSACSEVAADSKS